MPLKSSPDCTRYHLPHAVVDPGAVLLGKGASAVGVADNTSVVLSETFGHPPFGVMQIVWLTFSAIT